MATLEEKYTEQLQELGVYRTAFDGEIKTLAQMEREYRRLDKAWREDKDDAGAVCYTSKLYESRQKLRREILEHRDSLGLTPKGFKRLRPEASDAPAGGESHPFGALLAEITRKCSQYE